MSNNVGVHVIAELVVKQSCFSDKQYNTGMESTIVFIKVMIIIIIKFGACMGL